MIAETARCATLLSPEPIDVAAHLGALVTSTDGAVASFIGVIRNHNDGVPVGRLEYHAYAPMARRVMAEIAARAVARHQLGGITIVHRIGTLVPGEPGMLVAASAPHRRPALDACAEVVESLKSDLPVWKREHQPSGPQWLGAVDHG